MLTRASHSSRPTTAVTVRYSNSTGVPTIPDNDPRRSGPRGMAIRFHLAEHDHTDIVAHSTDGFPVRTGEEFLELLHAGTAFAAGQPEALGSFLAAHPSAKRFVEAPKPIPTSFAREAFFAVTAFKFTNADGVSRHGRFRIRPEEGTAYLSDEQAAEKYLKGMMEELGFPVPKTHDLDLLLTALAPHHPTLRSLRRGLLFLSDFAVDIRYPGSSASKRQAVAALRWAGRVRAR